MDMEDNKDILLNKLFEEAANTEIADNGFTRQVMRRLPSRAQRYNRIWTGVCASLAVFLLTYFKAWNYFLDGVINTCCAFVNINWLHILAVIILLPAATMLISSVFAIRELKLQG